MSAARTPDVLQPNAVKSYSCLPCRQRKIKCDRISPCSHCMKAERQCSFVAPVRGKRKRTKPAREGLHARLKRYEELLRSYGAKLDQETDDDDTDLETISPINNEMAEDVGVYKRAHHEHLSATQATARLVTKAEASRYFDSTLWSSLGEEFQHPDAADLPDLGEGLNNHEDDLLFGPELGFKADMLVTLHLPISKLISLKEIYLERVDPLMKILHVPSFWTMTTNALRHPQDMPKSLEAMIFSFYLATLSTMEDKECQALLGASSSVLCRRYRFAAKQALMNAGYLSTSSPMTLRAYTMFIMGIRRYYTCDTMFILSSIAIRLARKMGLHRDGTSLGLSIFDTEMRRRLWWHLAHMDYKTADTLGIKPSLDLFAGDAKIPWNVNDEDLHPDMTEPPQELSAITSISICLIKCEVTQALCKFSRLAPADTLADPNIPPSDKDSVMKDIEELLETKYIRYCDPINPHHTFISIMARSSLCKMKLFAYNARRIANRQTAAGTSESERNIVFTNATKLLEYATLIECGPHDLRKYMWHISTSYLLNIILYMIIEVRRRKTGPEVNRSWRLIGVALAQYPQILMTSTGVTYTTLSKWTLEAWDEYIVASKAEGLPEPATPEYINLLREYRQSNTQDSTKAKNATVTGENCNRPAFDVQVDGVGQSLPNDEQFGFQDFPGFSTFELDPNDWVQWDQVDVEDDGILRPEGMGDFRG